MMLKVSNDYLDCDVDVEVERKIKLFEEIDSSDGDVSFAFDVEETNKNFRLLGIPHPDSISKLVYQRIPCDLQDDSGVSLYDGFLRIERRVKRDRISLSFFSGNSNWFGLISGNLIDMDMSQYDIEQTEANIISSWANTSGLTFPLVDHGGLLTRSYPQVKIEDLVGGFYVSTVFKKIFTDSQIKLTGELFEERLYHKLITVKNSKDQSEINARSSYVNKTSTTVLPFQVEVPILYDDDSTYPFNDGSQDNFDITTSTYTADVKVNLLLESTLVGISTGTFSVLLQTIFVNGVQVRIKGFGFPDGPEVTMSWSVQVPLNAGDVLEIRGFHTNADGDAASLIRGTLKITPTFIYKTFGGAALPNWTKQQYVSSIFQVFNVITSFDPKTKTLTCNLFDKLKEKTPIDISKYVTVEETDFTEFISSYGKNSTFSYKEIDFDNLKEYNIGNFFKYSQGAIQVDNDFIPENEEILSSDFSNPFSYLNSVFSMSMERTNLIELGEDESVTFDDVGDSSGDALFHISDDVFNIGDLVRIQNSTNSVYNGDWVVKTIPANHITVHGLPFDTAASGDIIKLSYEYSNSDDVFLMVNIPLYPSINFSDANILFETTIQTSWGLAYFSILDTAHQINIDYKQSLSFGEIQDPLFYQRTILETYWSLVSRVLNDPVKPICTILMPANVYRLIDFLRPLLIETEETRNVYYCNLISGYKGSYLPARLDAIKLP